MLTPRIQIKEKQNTYANNQFERLIHHDCDGSQVSPFIRCHLQSKQFCIDKVRGDIALGFKRDDRIPVTCRHEKNKRKGLQEGYLIEEILHSFLKLRNEAKNSYIID